jgi:sugar phosphate isomerase/epimerase
MKDCLFSVSYAGYWGQDTLSLERFIPHAARLGYGAVMLAGKRPHASPLDMDPAKVRSIAALLRKHKLTCACIGAYTDFAPWPAPGIPSLEWQVAYVESLCSLAKSWGAGLVRVFTAYERPGLQTKDLWETNVRLLKECADRAARYGVSLAIQNHHDLGLDTEALLELLSEIGRRNCRLSFDAWSPALRGEDLYESARKAAPHTAITTNADYIRLPRWRYRPEYTNYTREEPDLVRAVPFGQGFIDYASFFRGLQEGGFQGWANYEMCEKLRGGGSLANLDRCAKVYLEKLKELA